MTACVFVCGRDEACIEPFLYAWRKVYDMRIVLVVDKEDPIDGDYGVETIKGTWARKGPMSQPVLESLVSAAGDDDIVLKFDVDCVHLSSSWLSKWEPSTMSAMGQHNEYRPGCFMGAAYILKTDTARKAALVGDCCKVRPEDVGVSMKTRLLDPNGIHLISRNNDDKINCICGHAEDVELSKYLDYGIIHCGQGIRRKDITDVMWKIINAHDDLYS